MSDRILFYILNDFIVYLEEPLSIVISKFKIDQDFKIDLLEYYPNSMLEI